MMKISGIFPGKQAMAFICHILKVVVGGWWNVSIHIEQSLFSICPGQKWTTSHPKTPRFCVISIENAVPNRFWDRF